MSIRRTVRPLILLTALLVGLPAAVPAQLHPAAPPAAVNVETAGHQDGASVVAGDGTALVVWVDGGERVVVRRLDAAVPAGPEIELTTAGQSRFLPEAAAAALPGGGWLVAWVEDGFRAPAELLLRRLDPYGVPTGDAVRIDAGTGGQIVQPTLAVDGAGRSVLTWAEPNRDPEVVARFFDAEGEPVGGVVPLTAAGGRPAATPTAEGYLFAWLEDTDQGARLVARPFDPVGNVAGPVREIFPAGAASPLHPVLAPASGGGAVAAWITFRREEEFGQPVESGVLAQRLDPAGSPRGPAVRLDVDRARFKGELRLEAIPGAGFFASWTGGAGGPSGEAGYGIAGRFLTPEAEPAGPERLLFTDDREAVFGHDLAGGSDGSLTAAWWSCRPRGFVQPTPDPCAGGGDGSGFGVFARRFETAAAGSLVLVPGPVVLGEAGGAASVTVERLGGGAGMVTVDLVTEESAGGATAGLDFEPRFETLVWGDGDRSPRTVTVPLLEDSRPEPEEAFSVELANPAGGARLGDPAAARFTIVDDDDLVERFLQIPFTVDLEPSEVSCDGDRLIGLHRRLRVLAPNTGKTTGVNLSLTASGDFAGFAYTGNGPGTGSATAEHHLTFSTNPEATTLLRNPARPQLPTVGFTRNRLVSDLVEPGAADVLRLVLDPTLESNLDPAPAAFLRIDNLERAAGGRPSDAKPGRGLLPLAGPCHGRLGNGTERVLQVLQRIVRAETPGAARHEISIHPGPDRDLYHVVVRPFDAAGGSLGSVTAEVEARYLVPVNPAENPVLFEGVLRVPPACPAIDPPIGGTVCHTLLEPTTIHLVRPTFSRELWEPTPYRVTTGPGEVTVEVPFGDLLPPAWASVPQR